MTTPTKPRIAILTFCVGADYKKAVELGLQSKRDYAKKYGYDCHIGGDDCWDRSRPIPWSKFNFIQKHLFEYDYLFVSDADVIIMNPDLTLETQVLSLLPKDKDLLWTFDACNHYNNGHMLIRGKSLWAKDFFKRAYEQTDLLHHIWWDNAAMIKLFEANPSDKAKIETCREHWKFNSYLFGPTDDATDTTTRLYKPGDFLIHLAGVYDPWNMYRFMKYVSTVKVPNPIVLNRWRKELLASKEAAELSLQSI
jgi:galactosyl transferase GMA12/MNN10 family